ncbi:hypothetical protein MOF38_19985 [Bacillus haynesii]|nr:hypothetical protein [Bacillus haynesii]MCY9402039.1 hypothetical protein [Bacillus haynesii]
MAQINTKDDLIKRAGAVFGELRKNGDDKRSAAVGDSFKVTCFFSSCC